MLHYTNTQKKKKNVFKFEYTGVIIYMYIVVIYTKNIILINKFLLH